MHGRTRSVALAHPRLLAHAHVGFDGGVAYPPRGVVAAFVQAAARPMAGTTPAAAAPLRPALSNEALLLTLPDGTLCNCGAAAPPFTAVLLHAIAAERGVRPQSKIQRGDLK